MRSTELARQLVHISVGAIAVSLRYLTWPQAAVMAVTAIAFNVLVLPRLFPGVLRPSDRDRLWTSGIVLYPMAVLGVILAFHDRLGLAAAAWGVLAAGDGVATLAGQGMRSPRLPWNPDKSVAGLVGFVLGGTAAATGLLIVVGRHDLGAPVLAVAALTALAAALVETIPVRLDDNLSVPATAAFVLWSASVFDGAVLDARLSGQALAAAVALAANGVVAWAGLQAKTVTQEGAVTGFTIGTVVAVGGGWGAWGLLMATFIAAAACTRIGAARKQRAGVAEERGGRRGPGNALANTGLAAWACGLSLGLPDPSLAWLACAAALVTAGSDTVASEIGKAYGRTTWLITSFRRVPRGTIGAISLEGTAAGLLAAAGLAALGAWWGLVPWTAVPFITAAATVASLIEGAVGATLETRGILNNDMVNFVNTAMAAGLTLLAATSLVSL
jgi:uncharacterized protein (TIGR00297 family)